MSTENVILEEIETNILSDFIANEGMKTTTAYNGREANEKFRSFSPSLVILDIMFPDDDGMEICRRIRNESCIQRYLQTFKIT
ncbi:hypothetical protein AN1V17_18870 [Vallitalea sediminicola]